MCCKPADGYLNDWPFATDNIKLNAQSWQWSQDVAEHDHAIWLKCFPRLQRQCEGYICCLGPFSEAVLV